MRCEAVTTGLAPAHSRSEVFMAPRWTRALVGVVSLLLFLPPPATPQEQTGRIEGVVLDAVGGVLPGATVEARHQLVG